ncbi:MAG TPA: hypothetical protein VK004_07885 [Ignavibacteria bacterium]|nr:hypothetical protein [Ignavibacteria bacterium]
MSKETEIMNFLNSNVFDPILKSPTASPSLKIGVSNTIRKMRRINAQGMLKYYWSSILGTGKSSAFARQMKKEGFTRFEEVMVEFRDKFNDKWLRSK